MDGGMEMMQKEDESPVKRQIRRGNNVTETEISSIFGVSDQYVLEFSFL